MGKREDCGVGASQAQAQGLCTGVCVEMWDQGRQIAPNRDWSLGNPGPLLTFFMLPRVTVDRALDIRRGLRPRNSPIFPSTCTMYLAVRRQRGWHHAQPRTPTAGPHTQTSGFPITAKCSQGVCPGSDTSQLRPQVSPDLSLLVERSTILLTNSPSDFFRASFLSFP